MPSPTGSLGLTYASFMHLGLDEALAAARLAQSLGYGSFWTAEITGPEAFAVLAAVGAAAPGLDLGSGVLPIQLRSPMLAAMGAATLQALHPDREIFLGVGISSPVVTQVWHSVAYGTRPLARMREYLTLVRACLSGEPVTFSGDFYTTKRFRLGMPLPQRRPRIVVGALNPRMLELAGELADGVLLNYLPASHVPWTVEQVRRGEARRTSERPCTVYANIHVGVCDRDAAMEAARRDLFSYAVVDAYAASFARAGFASEVEELRGRHAVGDRPGALAAVSEKMIDAMSIIGDATTVRDAVAAYATAGVDVPVVMPLPWGPEPSRIVADTLRAAAGG